MLPGAAQIKSRFPVFTAAGGERLHYLDNAATTQTPEAVLRAMDDYLRAFRLADGKTLWEGRLPAGGQATPMTYRARPGGRQYVVIAAGGHSQLATTRGDHVLAFALPDEGHGDDGNERGR